MTPLRPDPAPALQGAVEGASVALPGELGGTLAGPSALDQLLAKGRVRATLTMLGPAFVASIAYVDPGQLRDQHRRAARSSATCCCGSCSPRT